MTRIKWSNPKNIRSPLGAALRQCSESRSNHAAKAAAPDTRMHQPIQRDAVGAGHSPIGSGRRSNEGAATASSGKQTLCSRAANDRFELPIQLLQLLGCEQRHPNWIPLDTEISDFGLKTRQTFACRGASQNSTICRKAIMENPDEAFAATLDYVALRHRCWTCSGPIPHIQFHRYEQR